MDNKEIRIKIKGIRKLNIPKEDKYKLIRELVCGLKLTKSTKDYIKKSNLLIKNDKEKQEKKYTLHNNVKYFVTEDICPSVAEQLIIDIFKKHNIEYLREVSFEGCISEKGYYYRYDFYLPSKNLVIEYDGKAYHKEGNTKDIEKNKFCENHQIRIVRFNNKHYYSLEKHLLKLLKKYES
jgi:hypothetical protein